MIPVLAKLNLKDIKANIFTAKFCDTSRHFDILRLKIYFKIFFKYHSYFPLFPVGQDTVRGRTSLAYMPYQLYGSLGSGRKAKK